MLGKAATHIRPLLRVPAHQPDLFTSNPSLLHHFGHGQQGIVAQGAAQTASGSSGATGGAGRAGYSGASSGGYTGHARAFLSLPQTHSDASSIGASSDERKDKVAASRARNQLSLNGQSRRDESKLPRTVMVRERLTERQGSRPLRVLEIEQEEPQARRSKIAYPAWAALPAETGPGAPVWIAGAAPRPLGVRAYSTHTIHKDIEYVSATPPPEIQRLSQGNRVFQDLAGLDIGRRPNGVGQVRRNSTASAVSRSPDEEADFAIYQALTQKTTGAQQEALMKHYLSARDGPVDEAMAKEYPLPAGYTTATYNACLSILLRQRERGGSIAPILDTYNEMLSRDIVPNLLTTRLVITALCAREEDVSAASRRWQTAQDLEQYKEEKLGISAYQNATERDAAEAIKAYQSEDNLASAINLWRIIPAFNKNITENFSYLRTTEEILNAAVTAVGLPHATPMKTLLPVIEQIVGSSQHILSFVPIFTLYAAEGANAKLYISDIDKAVEACTRAAEGNEDRVSSTAEAYAAAIGAYIAAGAEDKAQALQDKYIAVTKDAEHASRYLRRLHSAEVQAYAESKQLDRALELGQKYVDQLSYGAFFALADLLVDSGRTAEMLQIYRQRKEAHSASGMSTEFTPDRIRLVPLMARLVYDAIHAPDMAAKNKALDLAIDFVNVSTPRIDMDIFTLFISQLRDAGRWNDIQSIMSSWQAGALSREQPALHRLMSKLVKSDAPLSELLKIMRAIARLGLRLPERIEREHSWSLASAIVQRYLAARSATEKTTDLGLSADAWFRLLECFTSMPSTRVDSGDTDEAFKMLMVDLAELRKQSPEQLKGLDKSPIVADLSDILVARFGAERSRHMLANALGETAAAHIPAPVEEVSTPEFSLPPTADAGQAPPSALQPPSAHTLHISQQLVALVERLTFVNAPDVQSIYATVREAITKDNAVPNPSAIARLIVALARAGDEPKVRELYSLAQVVLSSCVPEPAAQAEGWCAVEDAMIASCCILGHLEQAGMHRARIIDAGLAPSADAYATMIASSRDSTDDALVARELFEESQRLGVPPTLYLYNTIISKLSKARKAEMAIELFTHMKSLGIRPSSVTYGAIINACCRVGDEESATTLFTEMSQQPNFKPRVPPYNTMMQFHLQTAPSRDKIRHYYDAMRAARVPPSAHTYKLLLDAYGTLAPIALDAMERVFKELCANPRVPVQGTHWASLITAFGLHANDKERAMQVFESIPSHPTTRGPLEPVVWEAALNVLGQKGTLQELEALHQRMLQSGARQTAYVCNVLISGYSRHGAIDRAREVFEAMGDSLTGVAAPNNHPALLTSSGHTKPATTLPTDIVYREPSTYEAMVRAEIAAGDHERAAQVLRRMEDRRYPVAVWWKAKAILDEAGAGAVNGAAGTTTA